MPEVENRDVTDFEATLSLELLMIFQLPVALVLSRSSFTDLIVLNVWPSLYYQEVRRLLEMDSATSL